MTNTQKNKLEKALNYIQKCDGDCKHCEKCRIVTSENGLYYAFICVFLPPEAQLLFLLF